MKFRLFILVVNLFVGIYAAITSNWVAVGVSVLVLIALAGEKEL